MSAAGGGQAKFWIVNSFLVLLGGMHMRTPTFPESTPRGHNRYNLHSSLDGVGSNPNR